MKRLSVRKRVIATLIVVFAMSLSVGSARAFTGPGGNVNVQILGHGRVDVTSPVGGTTTCSTPRNASSSDVSAWCSELFGFVDPQIRLHATVQDSSDGWTFVGWQGIDHSAVDPNHATAGPLHCDGADANDFLAGPADCTYSPYFSPDEVYAQAIFRDKGAPNTAIDSGPVAGSTTNGSPPPFAFSSPDPNATFSCRLDPNSYASCTSPQAYSGLSGGSHTFSVRAKDPSGNVDSSPATRTWTVDVTPPTTTITSGPSGPTASTSASFSFTSGEAGATFQCSINGNTYLACASPQTYIRLSDRAYHFAVRARDAVGNIDPTPAARDWTVDTVAPDTVLDSGPSGASNGSVSFSFHSNEAGTSFQCKLDAGNYFLCTSPAPFTGLASGTHTVTIRALDAAGNADASPATRTWTVDATAPDTTITSGPSGYWNSASASIGFSSNETGVSFQCAFDGTPYAPCSSPRVFSSLREGLHAFGVRAIDAVGNIDASPVLRSWVVDTVPPETTLDGDAVTGSNATFSFSANESVLFIQCKLDAASYASCTSPRSYSNLAEGPHTFTVRAIDLAGNIDPTPADRTITIDTVRPETTIDSGPSGPVATTSASFSFSASESILFFECKLDTGPYSRCTSPQPYSNLMQGPHSFTVRAVDFAGNVDASPASRDWAVDTRDGLGTMAVSPAQLRAGSTGNTLTFIYTAAVAMDNSGISLTVPSGWSAPSTTGTSAGYVTATSGALTVSGRTIALANLTIGAGATVQIVYGSTSAGGTGAAAPGSGAVQTWLAKERSTVTGTLTALAAGSPNVDVLARDGTGTMTVNPAQVRSGSTGNTMTLVYTAAAGGTFGGTVDLAVPDGWSAPSLSPTASGYVTASAGTLSASGQTISVSDLVLAGGSKLTIVYGSKSASGPGATAPPSGAAQIWLTRQRSSAGGSLTPLSASPAVDVLAPDGSGTLTTSTTSAVHSSSGNTITFTYTAASGGIAGGTVAVVVPSGWSAPSTTATTAGSVTASAGILAVSAQTIKVSSLTLAAGGTLTITYGSRAGGAPGATAPAAVATQSWLASERSSPGGTLSPLAASPAISVE